MRVLTIYAHPNPQSFCHAVLERFTEGLKDGGHTSEVLDLYAVRFDPVFRMQDFGSYVHESMPREILEAMNLRQRVLDAAGGPVRRAIASAWIRGKDPAALVRFIRSHRPKDVVAHWDKVKKADALAFIAPVWWLHFPAILKGWFERVFTYGDAYALTADGWRGDVRGRVPLLQHEKALVMTPTLFGEEDYASALRAPMTQMIDSWGLRYPGIKNVEHVYFYRAAVASEETIRGYLARAYQLGKEF